MTVQIKKYISELKQSKNNSIKKTFQKWKKAMIVQFQKHFRNKKRNDSSVTKTFQK